LNELRNAYVEGDDDVLDPDTKEWVTMDNFIIDFNPQTNEKTSFKGKQQSFFINREEYEHCFSLYMKTEEIIKRIILQ
jgi:hypothetical protein